MRVVHWIKQFYPYMGGGETALYELCKTIEKEDSITENIIITSRIRGTKKTENLFSKTIIHRIGAPVNYDTDKGLKLLLKTTSRDLSLYRELKKHVNDDTIIHVHGPMPLPFIFRFTGGFFSKSKHFRPWENFGVPVIMHYHAEINNLPLTSGKKIARRDYDKCNRIISVDNYTSQVFDKKDKVIRIPNGVDVNDFKPSKKNRNMITFVGRIYPIKGWRVFAEGVKGMKNTLIIGHGPEEDDAKKIFDGKILPNVKNTDMKEYYSSAKIVVCPYQNPGISRVTLEAMACECIVIKSNIDPEPINNGVNGFTFQYDDPKNLRIVVTKILNMKKEELDRIRKKARKTIISNYSADRMTKDIIKVYEEEYAR